MTDTERKEAARQFINKWNGKGREDEDARSYWIDIIHDIMGVERATDYIEFQKKVIVDGNTKRIDAYIPETRVLIEQKTLGIALDKKIHQSGDIYLTPYEQAKRYNDNLPFGEKARWIVVSNFGEVWIYDMDSKVPEPVKLDLMDFSRKVSMLDFLVKKETKQINQEMEVSIKAGEIVGLLYDAFLKQYENPDDPETLKSLNKLCVRIVFCLYAEDADLFGRKNLFHDYMEQFSVKDSRKALRDLFRVLNQKPEERDKYLKEDDPLLALFPYVNGGLFADEDIDIPPFTDYIRTLLLTRASDGFDWSEISPTIFGAVFESTLNPETRRSGGMHYTSIENIHKVIDPLFLDELKEEFREIKKTAAARELVKKLEAYQDKLASLKWLDPAAGSGNFLTETYLCIRRLENETIRLLLDTRKSNVEGQVVFGFDETSPIKVSISQFYGIEINDFATTVAMTALWIAEDQMMKETESMIHGKLDFLPLKTNANIIEGNALRLDWETLELEEERITIRADRTNIITDVNDGKYTSADDSGLISEPEFRYGEIDLITKEMHIGRPDKEKARNHYDYIMGNPPFVGYTYQTKQQKKDLQSIYPKAKNIDYVAGWYFTAAKYMQNKKTKAAFVSTNSITQGEQVAAIWKSLIQDYNLQIIFAHRTFRWDSEASIKAHVHCVIVGFICAGQAAGAANKILFDNGTASDNIENISPYLIDAPDVFIEKRTVPLCPAGKMHRGSQPADNGNLILTEDEMLELVKTEPGAKEFIRPYMMGKDFISRKPRYCLWLVNAKPEKIKKCREVLKRIAGVREFRLKSSKASTRQKADTPTLFDEIQQPDTNFVALPQTSSENRRYIPMDFMNPDTIVGNKVYLIENATLYDFGILMSNVHNAWMRAVCGRLEMRYSYSNTIVYNNFPWPTPTEEQKSKIEKTAQAILDARALYPDSSLADLYDELTMPPELRKAHIENDKAVMKAYGFDIKATSEADCVAELMRMYQELVNKNGE